MIFKQCTGQSSKQQLLIIVKILISTGFGFEFSFSDNVFSILAKEKTLKKTLFSGAPHGDIFTPCVTRKSFCTPSADPGVCLRFSSARSSFASAFMTDRWIGTVPVWLSNWLSRPLVPIIIRINSQIIIPWRESTGIIMLNQMCIRDLSKLMTNGPNWSVLVRIVEYDHLARYQLGKLIPLWSLLPKWFLSIYKDWFKQPKIAVRFRSSVGQSTRTWNKPIGTISSLLFENYWRMHLHGIKTDPLHQLPDPLQT